jgi:hypothetical protein
MLKRTNVSLDTMQDHDMYLVFENSIRGGISQDCMRRSKANNKHCDGFNQSLPYITNLDANNLYGWSLSQSLPTGGLKWLTREEIDSLNVSLCLMIQPSATSLRLILTTPSLSTGLTKTFPSCVRGKSLHAVNYQNC